MNDKPISIVLEEFKVSISEIVNNSGLHPCIIEPIFKDFYNEINMLSKRQLELDKEQYEKKIKETTEE